MIRRYLRATAVLAFDVARVLGAEVAEWGGKKVAGLIFQAPEIRETGNPGFQDSPEEENVRSLGPEEVSELRRSRVSMIRKREPSEDNPPLEPPLVGSREWRAQNLPVR